MSDMISRDAAYDAIAVLANDATIIGQRTMISHALTAIRALPAVEVGVKPLEWVECDEPEEWRSGPYDVWCELGRYQGYHWSIVMGDPHATADAAKAAAQNHHDTSIRSALTATPAAVASRAQDATHGLESCMSQDVAEIGEAALENLLDRRGLREPLSAIKFEDPEIWREICEATGAAALARMKDAKA